MKLNKIAGAMLTAMLCMSTALIGAETPSSKPNGCTGPVLCSSKPEPGSNGCDPQWTVGIGLIYEQPAFVDMLPGDAFKPVLAQATSGTFRNQEVDILSKSFDYDLGLIANLGYFLEHDEWFIEAKFGWLRTTTKRTYNEVNVQYAPVYFLSPEIYAFTDFVVGTDYYTSIGYNAAFTVYDLDVLLSRGCYFSKSYSFDAFFGVKALWFSSGQTGKYFGAAQFDNDTYAIADQTQNNWGAGPVFGFNGEYHCVRQFSLFCDSDIAILSGRGSNVYTSTLTAGDVDVPVPNVIVSNYNPKTQFFVPIRASIGVKLSNFYFEEKHYVAVKLAYEARAVLSMPDDDFGFTMGGFTANFEWSF